MCSYVTRAQLASSTRACSIAGGAHLIGRGEIHGQGRDRHGRRLGNRAGHRAAARGRGRGGHGRRHRAGCGRRPWSREIEAAGGTARAQVVDVADADAVEAMVADTVAAFGGLDVLHNNAAALDQNRLDQDVVTMDLATWDRVLAVNLTGPMLGCRFAIPAMLERGGGSIVNTASAAAFYGSHSLAAYGTSKAGVVALTRYVATAYGERGIRCNAVAPGVVVDRKRRRRRSADRWATVCAATARATSSAGSAIPRRSRARSRSSRPTTPRS